jgi:hypothetical protein
MGRRGRTVRNRDKLNLSNCEVLQMSITFGKIKIFFPWSKIFSRSHRFLRAILAKINNKLLQFFLSQKCRNVFFLSNPSNNFDDIAKIVIFVFSNNQFFLLKMIDA